MSRRAAFVRRAMSMGAALGLFFVGAAAPASAYSKRVESACLADYKNLCPQYRPNTAQLRACMEAKQSQISWGCIEALLDSGEVDKRRVVKR